ncbi:uncharacterized protein LOC128554556 [Mercenaria mercenaria]|uniref:uncharacterized protein LOC128554556 n=1 Tax=Mercenaria mercenaria TaxID=6596 RepID=UPI00234E7712|nr:uncharacterized protein LOC128554556 [Mercenaria mercenaria]
MNIAEEKKLEVWSLIERYKKKNDDGDADEYLGQLRKSGMLVKTLRDIHEETVVRLKQSLRLLDETGINFKAEHDLELKILTTCQNEEKKKDAEEYLERNLHASINESDRPANLIRKETDKLVASISIHPDVKPTGVKRSCVLLSFRSSSPSGLIHILDYCGSHHFKARLHNIAKELHFLFEDAFLLQGHVTLESLFRETQNVDNTEDESHKGLSIPLKCSSVDGMRYVLDTLKNEKTTNRLNIIAEKISMELKETVSINMTPDLLEFRDVFDETDSEGSGSDGIIVDEVDKAEDKYSTEKELKLQKLDTNRKEFEHSPTICTDETVKSTCEKEEDSTLLRDSEGSDSGGIDADKVGKAGKRYSSAKERENQKLDADRKAAKHPLAICTDETEKSKCDQEEDSTLLPDSEGAGSGGTDADKADKLEDRYSSKKERDNQNLDTNKKAAEHPQTIWTDESEESTSGDENDLDFYLDSEGTDSGGADLDKADKAEDKYLSAKEWKNQELDAVEHSPIIWKDVIEGSTHEQEKDSTLLLVDDKCLCNTQSLNRH